MSKVFSVVAVSLFLLCSAAPVRAADCNENSVEDAEETAPGPLSVSIAHSRTLGSTTAEMMIDVDLDGALDAVYVIVSNGIYGLYVAPLQAREFSEKIQTVISGIGPEDPTPHTVRSVDADANNFLDLQIVSERRTSAAYNQGDNNFVFVGGATGSGEPGSVRDDQRVESRVFDATGDGQEDEVRAAEGGLEFWIRNEADMLVSSQVFELDTILCPNPVVSLPAADILPSIDIDSDGDLDIPIISRRLCFIGASAQSFDQLLVFENDGSGTFTQREGSEHVGTLRFLNYVDVDVNGYPDVVMKTSVANNLNFPNSISRTTSSGMAVGFTIKDSQTADADVDRVPDSCQRAVPGDFGGDRRGDTTIVRGIGGLLHWFSKYSSEPQEYLGNTRFPKESALFGLSDFDIPYAGDFDGDGDVEPGVVRGIKSSLPGSYGLYWYNQTNESLAQEIQWGLPGDLPQAGYFDSDNKLDRAVVRNLGGFLYWYVKGTSGTNHLGIPWGIAGDSVYAADVTGDGIDELVVARNFQGRVFWFVRSLDGTFFRNIAWGLAGDTPLAPADFDADGIADFAVARTTSEGLLSVFVLTSAIPDSSQHFFFGLRGDVPYIGYFKGLDTAELSVFREAPSASPFGNGLGFENQHFSHTPSGLFSTDFWGLRDDYLVLPSGKGVNP